jgi:murein DD-endopeptidase MepM/ murein hydrolase activator NlpD
MKLLFLSLIIAASSNIYSQERSISTKEFPVRNGIVTTDAGEGVFITSSNDSCFASEDGLITAKFKLPGEEAILVKKSSGTYVTYSNLGSTSVSRGDVIRKGTFIGLLKQGNSDFKLRYIVTNAKGKPFTQAGHITYLSQSVSL